MADDRAGRAGEQGAREIGERIWTSFGATGRARVACCDSHAARSEQPHQAVARALAATTPAQWAAFERAYRREMARPERQRTLALHASLSHHASFSVGCYCADEARCHRKVLRAPLVAAGAQVDPP